MARITELALKKLGPKERITDDAIEGFFARCLPSGKISFGYQYTDKATGQRRFIGIGLHGSVTVDEARNIAKRRAGQVAGGKDPAAELKKKLALGENTVAHVLGEFVEKHVKADKLRGAVGIEQALANHVLPVLGKKIIYSPDQGGNLTRGDIMNMIDNIAAKYPRMAHVVLAYLRAAFNWWQLRDEKFKSPIVRGMVKDKTVRRNRVLTELELADVWRALEEIEHVPASFPAFVKVLFLTACRRCEVSDMHTSEIDGDKWTIPAARYKTERDHVVPLIPAIKKLLPKTFGFVFGAASHRHHQAKGVKPLAGFQKPKDELDAAIARIRRREKRAAMPDWTFHDLRRTARTMMSEIGIDRETAEACLGHSKGAIVETYDQHKRFKEKTEALTKLAAHVDRITKTAARAATPAAKIRLVAS